MTAISPTLSSSTLVKIMSSSTVPLSWIQAFMYYFLLTSISVNTFLSPTTQVSYADHCNSVLPETTLTLRKLEPAFFSLIQPQYGYHTSQKKTVSLTSSENSNSLTFLIQKVYTTDRSDLFGVEGYLALRVRSMFSYVINVSYHRSHPDMIFRGPKYTGLVRFRLHGFWSESSGEVCMVGRGFSYIRRGKYYNPEAVLKLSNLRNSSSVTSLVTGTLESLSSTHDLAYFEPTSILIFPRRNYEYSLVSKEFAGEFSGGNDVDKGLPISSLQGRGFCSVISGGVNAFNLEYSSDCISAKNCNPLSAAIGYLPRIVYLKGIECLEEEKRMRVLVAFPNSSYVGFNPYFDPNTAFVGEGFWDDKMNQLCIVACRFLNATGSLASAQVGDCTTRLRLRFPIVWTIRQANNIVGKIWSRKAVNDSGYFNSIQVHSSENRIVAVPGLKYVYTQIDKARSYCGPREKPEKKKREMYPNEYSHDMQFDIRVRRYKGNSSWGYATPITVGDRFYKRSMFPVGLSSSWINSKNSFNRPINVSYKIGIRSSPGAIWGFQKFPYDIISYSGEGVEITAEGTYDVKTGKLCMVGCRNIMSEYQSLVNLSMDCEVFLSFQLPPLNSKKNGGYIKGNITSTRPRYDPLHFEKLDVSSASYTTAQAKQSISRMDLEIILALISNTLTCVFVGLQLLHVKQHPHSLPFISLVMLLLLTLRHMIPLVLNFEALFLKNNHQNILLGAGGWLEGNEVLVRLVTMVAFLLEFRLLQLSWSAKLADSDQKSLWSAENSTIFVSFVLYIAGALIFLLLNWSQRKGDMILLSYSQTLYPQNSLWENLKSYAGLVLDGFLLPQILLNMFRNSKQDALSCSFYIGTTFVRLLPHAYDLYRRHSYSYAGSHSYMYAIPSADFYSVAWDVIIPLKGLLFVAIIYLQQRSGGRCIIPQRFRKGDEFEMVPVVSESELPQE